MAYLQFGKLIRLKQLVKRKIWCENIKLIQKDKESTYYREDPSIAQPGNFGLFFPR